MFVPIKLSTTIMPHQRVIRKLLRMPDPQTLYAQWQEILLRMPDPQTLYAQTVDQAKAHEYTGYEYYMLFLIGASLSEPHTIDTALRMCVYACLQPSAYRTF